MMWGYGYNYGWGWVMMGIGGIVMIAVVVILVWALMRWLNMQKQTSGTSTPSSQSALDLLNQRYARGEIDNATFEQMRERLQGPEYIPGDTQRVPDSTRRSA